jgi:hypothetical protein
MCLRAAGGRTNGTALSGIPLAAETTPNTSRRIPPGKIAQGYYNLSGRTGFHSQLRHERCAGVAFVERPFFGRLSASIIFFNTEGGTMFKNFVGRDDSREFLPDQLAAFRKLAEQLSIRK